MVPVEINDMEAPSQPPTKSTTRPVSSRPVAARNRKITKSAISQRPDTGKTMTEASVNWLDIERKLAKKYPHATAENLARLTAQKIQSSEEHSHLYYRISASKWLSTSTKAPPEQLQVEHTPPFSGQIPSFSVISNANIMRQLATDSSKLTVIEFAANRYAVSGNDSHIRLKVVRENRTNKRILFKYETLDGSAKRGKDYISQSETLVFNPAETEKLISIQLLPESEKEPDEMFYVKLSLEDFADGRTLIGTNNVAMVKRK